MPATAPTSTPVSRTPATVIALFLLLLALAAGIRGLGLVKGPADYQPVRQYFTAMIARYLDLAGDETLPDWKREYLQATLQPIHEPPILEGLSIVGFRLTGGESLWLPRAISASAWLVGGWLLFLVLRRLVDPPSALLGTAFFLLAPFGIDQSLSFQPDSLMLAVGIGALLAILAYHRTPSRSALIRAGLVSAAAILIKPQVAFLIAGAYAGLALGRMSMLQLLRDRDAWLFALVALLPALVYMLGNALFIGGIEAQRGILPASLLKPGFYLAWLYNIGNVVGYPVFVLGLGGLALARGDARALGLGLLAGYVLLGCVFTYHIATHTYYHIPLLLPLAVGLAALSQPVLDVARNGLAATGLALVGLLALALALVPVLRSFDQPGVDDRAPLFREIGERVGHSRRVLMYASSEGLPLMYHAWIAGKLWPSSWHKTVERVGLGGITVMETGKEDSGDEEVARRFEDYRAWVPEFFVVTWMEDFRAYPELRRYLDRHFPRVAETGDYLIYDLRGQSAE